MKRNFKKITAIVLTLVTVMAASTLGLMHVFGALGGATAYAASNVSATGPRPIVAYDFTKSLADQSWRGLGDFVLTPDVEAPDPAAAGEGVNGSDWDRLGTNARSGRASWRAGTGISIRNGFIKLPDNLFSGDDVASEIKGFTISMTMEKVLGYNNEYHWDEIIYAFSSEDKHAWTWGTGALDVADRPAASFWLSDNGCCGTAPHQYSSTGAWLDGGLEGWFGNHLPAGETHTVTLTYDPSWGAHGAAILYVDGQIVQRSDWLDGNKTPDDNGNPIGWDVESKLTVDQIKQLTSNIIGRPNAGTGGMWMYADIKNVTVYGEALNGDMVGALCTAGAADISKGWDAVARFQDPTVSAGNGSVIDGTFKIASYNIDGLALGGLSGGTSAANTTALAKRLVADGIDIICVQENFSKNSNLTGTGGLTTGNYYAGTFSGNASLSANNTCDGLGIFCRKATIGALTYGASGDPERIQWNRTYPTNGTFSTSNGADGMIKKGFRKYTVTVGTVAGKQVNVDVYVVHMDADDEPQDNAARLTQIQQLAAYIKEHSTNNPIIITGDMNCRYARDPLYRELIQVLNSDPRFTVADTWSEYSFKGSYPKLTDEGKFNWQFGTGEDRFGFDKGEDVDKIIYVNNTNSEYELILDNFKHDNTYTSNGQPGVRQGGLADHYPAIATFSYAKRGVVTYKDNANGTLFADDVHRVFVNEQTPEFIGAAPYWENSVPQRKGYVFKGWSTNANADTSNTYTVAQKVTGNVTYYAIWAPVYSVTYNDNAGGALFATQVYPDPSVEYPTVYEKGMATPAFVGSNPVKAGYYFRGWTTTKGSYTPNWSSTVQGNTTYYPAWAEIYTVTFAGEGVNTANALYKQKDIGQDGKDKDGNTASLTITLPAGPTRSGYSFKGWRCSADGALKSAGSTYTVASDVTFTAEWEGAAYTVTLDYNDGVTANTTAQVSHGATYTFPATDPTREGYTFDGWQLNGSGTVYKSGASYPNAVTGDLTFKAKWTKKQYTITLNYNYDGAPTSATAKVEHGENYTFGTNPTRTGYDFGGWYLESAPSTTYTNGKSYGPVTGDLTFKAKWTQKEYTITLNYNYTGAPTSATAKVKHGENYTFGTDPVREGYDFLGWSLDSAATTYYKNGQSYGPVTGALTFKARWSQKEYTITRDYNYTGAPANATSTVKHGATYTFPANPTRTGYDFDGWYLDSAPTTLYKSGDTYENVTGALTFKAKWTQKYTVTLNYNYTSGPANVTTDVRDGESYTFPEDPTRTGYDFLGWSLDSAATTYYKNGQSYPNVTANLTFKARWSQKEYTITLDHNYTGSTNTTSTVKHGAAYTFPANPTRTGYDFGGWYLEADPNTTYTSGNKYNNVTGDLTFKAKWTKKQYTITLNYNYTGAPTSATAKVEHGSAYTFGADPTRDGYDFGGWYLDSAPSTTYKSGNKYNNVTGNLTFKAKWTKKQYTITLDPGYTGSTSTTATVEHGDSYTFPANPTRTGYDFGGWYLESATGTTYKSGDEYENVTGNLTFKAKWTLKEYTITLNYNDGGVTASTTSKVKYNENYTFGADPTRTGYDFGGWYLDSAPSTTYKSGQSYGPVTGNLTFKAKWTLKKYTLTFDRNFEGAPAATTATVEHGAAYTFQTTPTRTGYDFGGWYLEADPNTTYKSGDKYENVTGNLTFKAKWTKKQYTITLNYNYDGAPTSATAKVEHGSAYTFPENPTREGYDFDGWYLGNNQTTLYKKGEKYPNVTGALTFTAKWTKKQYTITLDPDYDGSTPTTVTVEHGDSYAFPANPTRTGYDFGGWYLESAPSTTYRSGGTYENVTGDLTFKAKWTKKQYTITLNYNDGVTANTTSKVEHGTAYIFPENPTREGYDFDGWYVGTSQATLYKKGEKYPNVTGALTFTAKWTLKKYTLTFDRNFEGAPAPTTATVNHGAAYTFQTLPTRPGYTFDGWRLEGGDGTLYKRGESYSNVTGPLTFKAQWTKNKYTITLKLGYTDAPTLTPTTVEWGDSYTFGADPEREGYTFDGWFCDVDAYDTLYKKNDAYENVTENLTFTAKWTRKTYTLTLIFGNGTADGKRTVSHGDRYTFGTNPTRTGYDFDGWYLDGTSTPLYKNGDKSPAVTENLTFYAKWTQKKYKVTLDYNYTGAPDSVTAEAVHGSSFPFPKDPTRTDYAFDGWYLEANPNKTYKYGESYSNVTEELTFKAKWTRVYTVTYEGDSIDGITQNPRTVRKAATGDTTLTLPTLTRDGYEFNGWTVKNGDGTTYTGTYTLTDNITFVAKWTRVYTISFVGDGFTDYNETLYDGTNDNKITLPTQTYTGHRFDGWLCSADGKTYDAGAEYTVSDDVTFTAKWTAIYSVTFRPGYGANNAIQTLTGKVVGDSITLLGAQTRTVPADGNGGKYVFLGWLCSADNKVYDAASEYVMTAQNVTFTAQWKRTYTVKYSDGVTASVVFNDVEHTVDSGAALPQSGFTKEQLTAMRLNYMFRGWATSVNGTPLETLPETVTKDVTYYAVWGADNNNDGILDSEQPRYTVTYNDGVATAVVFDDVEFTSILVKMPTPAYNGSPSTPKRTGYVFGGWSKTEGATEATGIDATVTADVTYYAVWFVDANKNGTPDKDEDHFTITYTDGIGGVSFETVNFEDVVVDLATPVPAFKTGKTLEDFDYEVPVREGYVFVGWDGSSSDGVGHANNWSSTVIATVKYVAVWKLDANGNDVPDDEETTNPIDYVSNYGTAPSGLTAARLQRYVSGIKVQLWQPAETWTATVSGSRIMFIGWSETNPGNNLTWTSDPSTITEITTGTSTKRVYAVWAYDRNANNIPDYKESRYTISFDKNGGEGTDIDPLTNRLFSYRYDLPEIEDVDWTKGDATCLAGWSLDSTIPTLNADNHETYDSKMITALRHTDTAQDKVVLYAVYAVDENGDGIPDYRADSVQVKFDANGGAVKEGYEFEEGNVFFICDHYHRPNDTIEIGESFTFDEAAEMIERENAVLIGWSLKAWDVFDHDPETETEEVFAHEGVIGDDGLVIYAVWAEDVNGEGTPDYEETKYDHKYYDNMYLGGSSLPNGVVSVSISSCPPTDSGILLKTFVSLAKNNYLGNRWDYADEDQNELVHHYIQLGWSDVAHAAPTSKEQAEGWLITGDAPNKMDGDTLLRFIEDEDSLGAYAVWAVDDNENGTPDYEESFTVRYDHNGGTGNNPTVTVRYRGTTRVGADPTREGYRFNGWLDADGKAYRRGETITVTDDITLTAQWIKVWNVTTHSRPVGGTETETTVDEKSEFTLPGYSPRENYIFDGWLCDADGKLYQPDETYASVESDVTFTGKWTRQYNVTFSGEGFDDTTEKVNENASVTFPQTDARENYVFAGWTDGENTYAAGAKLDKVTSDKTFTTVWKEDRNNNGTPDEDETKYTVTYEDGVEGEELFPSETIGNLIVDDETPGFSGGTPSRDGYVFGDGWTTTPGGTDDDWSDTVTGNVTYYAIWLEDKNNNGIADEDEAHYTVTYRDGANGSVFTTVVHSNVLVGLQTPAFGDDPVREGYVFAGWNPTVVDTVTKSATYTATWKVDRNGNSIADEDEEKYTVTYTDGLGGAIFNNQMYTGLLSGEATTAFDGEPVRSGFIFDGWATTAEGKADAWDDTVSGTVTYYAIWREDRNHNGKADEDEPKYTVTYTDGVDGDVFADQTKDGLLVTETTPAFGDDPVRAGYVFAGWTPEVADTVSGNATYTATWKEDRNNNGVADEDEDHYTVTYTDGVGGDVFEDRTTEDLLVGETTPAFGNDPVRAGYVFAGWRPAVAGTVTGNATYTATWKRDRNGNGIADENEPKYTVTYADGVGGDAFADQTKDGLLVGETTPEFEDEPVRDGYVFAGWTPEVAGTVTADVIYTATWKEDRNNNGKADEDEPKYTVTYTDGVGGDVFAAQTTGGLLDGETAPEFVGEPERAGYVFAGWSPEVAHTVTEDATYTATWKEDKNNNGKADEDEDKYTVTYRDGVGGNAFAAQTTGDLLEGNETPAFDGTPVREGYVFAGWSPAVAGTVTGNATYTARWKEDKNNNGKADEDEDRYTVIYTDGVGGAAFDNQTAGDLLEGDATPAFDGTPERDGYVFAGWATTADGKADAWDDTVSGTVTYYAIWREDRNNNGEADEDETKYTVTYTDGVGGDAFAAQTTGDLLEGDATPEFDGKPVRAGYVFAGWSPEVAHTVTGDATYTATWKEDKNNNGVADEEEDRYTVTYTDGVGGAAFENQTTGDLLEGDATPEFVGEPERAGYVFAGWRPAVANTVSGDATYRATWKEDRNNNGEADEDETKYTVTYTDGVDGDAFEDQTAGDLLEGDATPEFDGKPEREGYVFAGWTPEVAGTVTGNATYTATWKEDKNHNGTPDEEETKYTVTYTDGVNGDAFADQTKGDLLEGDATPAFVGEPERGGYVFAGWTPEVAGTVTEDATYTATWKEDKNNNGVADEDETKYSVTYTDGVGGDVFADQTADGLLEGDKTPAFEGTPEREGYIFAGWTPEVAGTVTGNATYTATWKEDKNNNDIADEDEDHYNVTYTDGVGGTIFGNQTHSDLLEGDATPAFEGTPVRKGYIFAGWATTAEGKADAWDDTVSGTVTYYAIWLEDRNDNGVADEDEDRYNVTYTDGVNGDAFADQTTGDLLEGDATPAFVGEPEREGYIFAGWTPAVVDTVTEDATYTATWKEDKNGNGVADEDEDRYNVTYTDGVNGDAFADQTTGDLLEGDATPEFDGIPEREGYVFAGWTPEVADTVTGNATYTATWKEDKNGNGVADEDEDHYNVTYTDGVGGNVFADQTTDGLLEGDKTPAFEGTPERDGYVFAGWATTADGKADAWDDTVSGTVTYYAIWLEDRNNNGVADDDEEKYSVTYTDGVGGDVFADQTTDGLLDGETTPAFEGEPKRAGYIFAGWTPAVADTVTGNATYTATWKEDKNNNGVADEEETKYSVTYTDGVEDEEIFADQTTDGLLEGDKTPAFDGTPVREGYIFAGWTPAVANTVTGNATYTATWKVDANNNGVADDEEICTVEFVADGDVVATITKQYGETMTEDDYPEVPVKAGYYVEWPVITDPITGSMTIEAVYVELPVGDIEGDIVDMPTEIPDLDDDEDVYLVIYRIVDDEQTAKDFLEGIGNAVNDLNPDGILPIDVSMYTTHGVKITEVENGVIVEVYLPDDVNPENGLVVYRLEDDGTYTLLDSKLENGAIIFETTHFSTYVIAELAAPKTPDEPAITGDEAYTALWLMLIGVSATAIALIAYDGKRKRAAKLKDRD